jgi:hypothetical protein
MLYRKLSTERVIFLIILFGLVFCYNKFRKTNFERYKVFKELEFKGIVVANERKKKLLVTEIRTKKEIIQFSNNLYLLFPEKIIEGDSIEKTKNEISFRVKRNDSVFILKEEANTEKIIRENKSINELLREGINN